MAIFPLKEALNNSTLIKNTCRLYRLSFLKVLPLSLVIIAVYHLFVFYGAKYQQPLMFAAILCLPIFGMIVSLMLAVGEEKPVSYRSALQIAFVKFLSLIGALISILLLPLIVFGVGLVLFILMGRFLPGLPPVVFILSKILIAVAVFLALVSKIIAPILVFSENKDANSSVDIAAKAVKKHFGRTVFLTLYGFLLLWFIAILPELFQYYSKIDYQNVLQWVAEVLLVINLPWVIALLVMQAKDLFFRWEKAI